MWWCAKFQVPPGMFDHVWTALSNLTVHFLGFLFTLFPTSKCGIPNWPGWSPKQDFDGLDKVYHWTLRIGQGEAGQGGAHLEGPRCLQSAWKSALHYKNFFSLKIFISKIFQILYYKNGEMPNLLVWSANKVPEGGVTGKNFFSKIHSKFY